MRSSAEVDDAWFLGSGVYWAGRLTRSLPWYPRYTGYCRVTLIERAWWPSVCDPSAEKGVEGKMANLTISIEDELLKRARVRAAVEGTSVNAVLRAYLEEWTTRRQVYRDAGNDFLRIVGEGKVGSGGNRWTRDELHDR